MIKIKNLSKKFNNFIAVNNINIEIEKWICFWLLGRNWAWKSTTMKMMVWLIETSNWSIEYDWVNIETNPLEIKKKLAYIPDTPYIYNKLTWNDFLNFIWYSYWLDKFTIQSKWEKFLKLFDIFDMKHERIENYSHWMKQKLAFTAALMHNPEYLILDEPMVWLDVQSAKAIKEIIKHITKKWVTVIITTHQISVAIEICDRIWIIHDWELKKILNDKNDINNLEDIFLKTTWEIDNSYLERINE